MMINRKSGNSGARGAGLRNVNLRGGKLPKGALAALAALGAVFSVSPANAQTSFEEAHALRSLDIMLMVTSLRCRSGAHDFRADYQRFSATHLGHLNAAGQTLRHSFHASYGEPDPERALDRMGVRIANSYGDGHPWMECPDLQRAARELAQVTDPRQLTQAARVLLGASRPDAGMRIAGHGGVAQALPVERQNQPSRIGYAIAADWEAGQR